MAKIRKTASIENGIMQVLKILNEDEIQETIGKSSSYLRKCSDPSQQQQSQQTTHWLCITNCQIMLNGSITFLSQQ